MDDKGEPIGESNATAISHLLEECRMVLPGIQALFGFQLIVVFNQGFWDRLNPSEQRLHLLSVVLIALAVALVMTPAAYHRQTKPALRPEFFISLSSRLLLWSMFPLMIAICIDFYLIARMILLDSMASLFAAMGILVIFLFLWLLLPRSNRLCRRLSK